MNPTLYKTQWAVQQDWDDPIEREEDEDEEFHLLEGGNEFIGKGDFGGGVISILNRLYEFRGGLTVEKFLRQNSSLADVLMQTHEVVRSVFRPGTGTRMILEVVIDPEFPADQQLFVIARTKIPRKLAREYLSMLEQGWWQSVPLEIRKKVELDIEPI